MIKKTIFVGTGFDTVAAVESANLQADNFINNGGDRRIEKSRVILKIENHGSFTVVILELTYETINS